jgi:hypothetical protein
MKKILLLFSVFVFVLTNVKAQETFKFSQYFDPYVEVGMGFDVYQSLSDIYSFSIGFATKPDSIKKSQLSAFMRFSYIYNGETLNNNDLNKKTTKTSLDFSFGYEFVFNKRNDPSFKGFRSLYIGSGFGFVNAHFSSTNNKGSLNGVPLIDYVNQYYFDFSWINTLSVYKKYAAISLEFIPYLNKNFFDVPNPIKDQEPAKNRNQYLILKLAYILH